MEKGKGFLRPNYSKWLIFAAGVLVGLSKSYQKYSLLFIIGAVGLIIFHDLLNKKKGKNNMGDLQ